MKIYEEIPDRLGEYYWLHVKKKRFCFDLVTRSGGGIWQVIGRQTLLQEGYYIIRCTPSHFMCEESDILCLQNRSWLYWYAEKASWRTISSYDPATVHQHRK